MKAAIEALPFERPKLAMTAVLNGADFAERRDRAIEASRQAQRAQLIEARPTPPSGPEPTPTTPFPRLRQL